MIKKMNKKGVFGLTAVQGFFAIILGIALLAYVIVIIMGSLQTSTILSQRAGTVVNETGAFVNTSGYTLTQASLKAGFSTPVITEVYNVTNGIVLKAGNYTLTGNVLYNASAIVSPNVYISYTYMYDTDQQSQLGYILGNTSTGVSGFFANISPVYAVLAVLVIILVLVVLVRVVQAPGGRGSSTQL